MTSPSLRLLPPMLLCCLTLGLAMGCKGAGLGTVNQNNNTNGNGNQADSGVDPDASLCGVGDDEKVVENEPRIWNGTAAPEQCVSAGQQLAVGALIFQYYGWTNGCTGTVINDNTVLTAAHCVQRWNGDPVDPTTVRFTVGRDALDPHHTFNVTAVYDHPGYTGDAPNDLGLMVLAEPISAAPVQILPIPVNQTDLTAALVGAEVQNAGFGETEVTQDNSLLWWTVEEITAVEAGEFTVFGGGAPNGSSVCYGDSGGPSLYLWGGNRLALLGTVSWGDPSCMDYDHFARADFSLTWIENRVGTLDPCVGIDSAGVCDGDVALWCDGGQLRQQCCGDAGGTCAVDAQGQARCTGDQCNGLTWQGECQGSDAVWCENGQIKRRRCGPCDQVCGWVDSVMGYYCVDP